MDSKHDTTPSILDDAGRWLAVQRKHLGYGLSGFDDLSWSEWRHGLATGLVATADAASFGATGRVADWTGAQWYDDYRDELGFGTARSLAVVARDTALIAYPGIAGRGITWERGALKGAVQGITHPETGAITIRAGIEGKHLARVVRPEQLHSFALQHMPDWARDLATQWYKRKGLWTWFEEASAEFYATGRPFHAVRYPFARPYLNMATVRNDAWALGRWALVAAGVNLIRGDEGHAPVPFATLSIGGLLAMPRVPEVQSQMQAIRPSSAIVAPRTATWQPTPMSCSRGLFESRLTDANRVMFGTQFGIDGVAVELTEGSPVAKVEFDSVLLTDGPEVRGGHMALTRADAQIIERRVNQMLAEWSVHRRFGARLTASQAVGDEAQLTIDGVRVVLKHARSEATVAGQPVQVTPPPRRALGNMTLAPSAWATLDLAIAAAKRAAQPEPAPQAALPPLWSAETAATNSVFRQEPKTLFGSQFGLNPFGSGF